MTKLDRLAIMAAILCVANESSKKGSGVSDYDLEHATTQALMLHNRLEERLANAKSATPATDPTPSKD